MKFDFNHKVILDIQVIHERQIEDSEREFGWKNVQVVCYIHVLYTLAVRISPEAVIPCN